MSTLKAILVKEVKTLLRDRYILFGVILAPFLALMIIGVVAGLAYRGMAEQVEEAGREGLPKGTLVCLRDPSDKLALRLVELLGVDVGDCEASDYEVLVVIHEGFGSALTSGYPGLITIRVVTDNPLSMVPLILSSKVDLEIKQATSRLIAEMYGVNATLLSQPVVVTTELEIGGRRLTQDAQGVYTMISVGLIVIILALSTTSIQVGSLSIGVEREARTIEGLMILPTPRWQIVVGKAGGTLAVSLLSIISLTAGLIVYLYGFTQALPVSTTSESGEETFRDILMLALNQMGVGVSNFVLALLALTLSIAICSLLGVIIGILFAGDVRGALTTGSYAGLALIAPLFPTLLGYEPSRLLEALFLLSPIYAPARIAMLSLSGDMGGTLPYVIVSVVYALIIMLLAAASFRPGLIIGGVRGLLAEIKFALRVR